MKLRTKLIITFLTLILLPIALMSAAIVGVSALQLRSIEKAYGIEDTDYETLSNSTAVLSKITRNIHQQIQSEATENPDKLEDVEYLEKMNSELKAKYSYLLVRRDGALIYKGREGNLDSLMEHLPEYGDYKASQDSGIYIGGNVNALVKQIDFRFSDRSEGSAFIITSVEGVLPEARSLIVDMVLAVISILVITSASMTAWIYKSIVTPIERLKLATQNIRDGNLDFHVASDTQDEIGELCTDFEEMRRRLKSNAEEKIEYDSQSKELITNISHDLKTPITAVKGYVEGLLDGVAVTPEKQEKYLRTIYNKTIEMDRLINELTFYSKIDTNRIPYKFEKINVNAYFEDCVDELNMDLEQRGIRLAYFNYVEEDVVVIADAEQLKRVINNIVGNSIKYMDKPDGYINIRVKDVGDFVQVEIEDNGKGIATKDLPYIFDRFYRTDASRNSSQGGSGIGLSIVQKIMEDHGGKIWATSREGTGTVMYFVLRKYQEVPVNE